MSNVKNFGLVGVGNDVQLGKGGPHIVANSAAIEARDDLNNLTNLKAAPGVDDNDVVVKSQLAGAVGELTGFAIPLGNVTADGDGSYAPGAVTLTESTPVTDAIDRMNEVLALLVPPAPPAFPNGGTLTVTNTSGSTPLLADGGVPNNTTNTTVFTVGNAVTRISATTVNSNTFNDVGPGDSGTVSLYVNESVVGDIALTGTGQNGTYNGLVIADQNDYPTTTPGFWKSIDVSVSGALANVGINSFKISHSEAGETNVAYFVRDNVTSVPSITSGSVSQASAGTLAYSSSVPHYGTGGTLTVGFSTSNLAGETYYGGSDPFVISGTNSIFSSQTFTYAGAGINTPIARQTINATAITPVTVNVNGSTHGSGVVQAVAKNVNGSSTTTNVASTVILVMNGAGTGKVVEMSVPVTGLGSSPNSNNAVRVSLGSGDTPTGSSSAWTASASLSSHEATVVAGALKHDQTNYSTGYLPVGPDLSSGRSGAQYATFSFNRTALSTFKIVVTGTYAACWVKLPGVSDNAAISPNASNGWWDMTKLYDGAGVPGEGDDTNAGAALGTIMSGSSGTFTATFGTQTSSNSTGNQILVRFKLNAGQTITALSFTN